MKMFVAAALMLFATVAHAEISRSEVVDRAKAYVYYPWSSTAANETASCVADYESAFRPGDYIGVAYDWGGFASLFDFDQKIADGYGAGSPAFGEVFWCTVGVDCSGFISRAWHTSQKYGTATIHQVSHEIEAGALLSGDIFNKASFHVAMFIHMMANGEPFLYEAVGFNTHVNSFGGWAYVDGYTPRRYDDITGTTVATTTGTLNEPIVVDALPFVDSRDTRESLSDLLDGCAAAPGTNESGPEVVYELHLDEPGTLTVTVSDDASADIDVHLYQSWNTSSCFARHDSSFSESVDCGTYYVVADTYGGDVNAGIYDITISFSADAATACGEGSPPFDPEGGLGDACAYPDDASLPFCNPTLGGEVCLYTSGAESTSFCTVPCAAAADCAGLDAGCCSDIGNGELYCLRGDLCPTNEDPEDSDPDSPEEPDSPDQPEGEGEGDPSAGPAPKDGGGGCQASGGASGVWVVCAWALWFFGRRRRFRSHFE